MMQWTGRGGPLRPVPTPGGQLALVARLEQIRPLQPGGLFAPRCGAGGK